MRRALPLLVVVALLVPAAAEAKIVIGLSIASVRLGDSAATAKRKLGAPQSVMHRPGNKESIYNYTRRKLTIRIRSGRGVIELNSFSSHEKTSKGVGVGSLLTSVDSAYPGACDLDFAPHCAIAKTVSGRQTSTQFDAGASRDTKHVGAVKVQWLLPLR
jgi:hypothetical protein